MSAKLPFLPLHVAEFLADTEHLDGEETGAYLRILMSMWMEGASASNEAARLCRIARVSPRKWPAVWKVIGGFFSPDGEGRITQKRLKAEYTKAVEIVGKRRESGKRGGEAKALRTASIGLAIASVLPDVSQQVASRLPWHKNIERKISNLTTSEQEPAPVVEERSELLNASLRRMGRLKDGKDEEAA